MQPEARIDPGDRNGTGLPGVGVDGTLLRAAAGVPGTEPDPAAVATGRGGLAEGTSAGLINDTGTATLFGTALLGAARRSGGFVASASNGILSEIVFFSSGPMGNEGLMELGF